MKNLTPVPSVHSSANQFSYYKAEKLGLSMEEVIPELNLSEIINNVRELIAKIDERARQMTITER